MVRRRTIRWTGSDYRDEITRALPTREDFARVEVAAVFNRFYVRAECHDSVLDTDPFRGGWWLADGSEIFVLTAQDPPQAQEIAQRLQGAGGLRAISDLVVAQNEILVEYHGNPVLLFALVDIAAHSSRVSRRSLFPLHDATLAKVAAHCWNSPDLEPMRILEMAAGEDAW